MRVQRLGYTWGDDERIDGKALQRIHWLHTVDRRKERATVVRRWALHVGDSVAKGVRLMTELQAWKENQRLREEFIRDLDRDESVRLKEWKQV